MPFDAVWRHLTQIWRHLRPFDDVFNYFALFYTIWRRLTPSDAIWRHLTPFEAIGYFLMPVDALGQFDTNRHRDAMCQLIKYSCSPSFRVTSKVLIENLPYFAVFCKLFRNLQKSKTVTVIHFVRFQSHIMLLLV